jgi:hypothetical protein
MKQEIKISDDLSLPADLVSQTIAFLAKRGMGKSFAADVMIEGMAAIGAQVVIIDPTDCHWGLKSSADGKSEGFPFIIFGGNHSDIELLPESGKVIAEFVVESGQSIIICTRLLSNAKARQVVGDFFEHLYHIKGQKGKNTPIFCMIDECDLFVPQFVTMDVAKCVGAIDDATRRGRNVGIGIGLISQRPAKVNKDVLSQVEVLIAMQTGGTHDRKALKEWIEANADADRMNEFISELVKLQRGEAWIWSPSWLQILKRIKFISKKTFDSGYTPRAGETRIIPRKLAQVDLAKLSSEIQSTIQRSKDNDPVELKRKLAEVQKELAKAKTMTPDVPKQKPEKIEVPIFTDRDQKILSKTSEDILSLKGRLATLSDGVEKISARIEKIKLIARSKTSNTETIIIPRSDGSAGAKVTLLTGPPKPQFGYASQPKSAIPEPVRHIGTVTTASQTTPYKSNGEVLGKCERSILKALAQYPNGRTAVQAALLSGYSVKSGGFNNSLGKLRSLELITREQPMRITEAGLNALGDYTPLPTGQELANYWINKLGRCESLILKFLVDNYPTQFNSQQVGEATGYSSSSGGFNNALGRLRTLELITRGPLKATSDFFEI